MAFAFIRKSYKLATRSGVNQIPRNVYETMEEWVTATHLEWAIITCYCAESTPQSMIPQERYTYSTGLSDVTNTRIILQCDSMATPCYCT